MAPSRNVEKVENDFPDFEEEIISLTSFNNSISFASLNNSQAEERCMETAAISVVGSHLQSLNELPSSFNRPVPMKEIPVPTYHLEFDNTDKKVV